MSWLFLSVICVVLGAIVLVAWRKWIAPWRHIDQLVRQIAGGEQPRTFLVDGGTLSQRVGLALENIFRHQQQLDQQIAGRESGTQTILGAMQDGLLVAAHRVEVPMNTTTFPDERLELIFTCCHPALALEAQVALSLRTLGRLTTDEIARAFLVPERTVAQRLVRAKRKIKAAGIPFRGATGPCVPQSVGT